MLAGVNPNNALENAIKGTREGFEGVDKFF